MLALIKAIVVGAFFAAFRPRASLVAENVLLRQALAMLHRATPRAAAPARRPRVLGRRLPAVVAVGGRASRGIDEAVHGGHGSRG